MFQTKESVAAGRRAVFGRVPQLGSSCTPVRLNDLLVSRSNDVTIYAKDGSTAEAGERLRGQQAAVLQQKSKLKPPETDLFADGDAYENYVGRWSRPIWS
ncbi:MAG TPA: hypothetical protein VKB89_19230 [Xanthobacteraceae bacterium]|nr:hypothetical protein [Xanthobacteraceae bacterium]